MTEKTIEPGQDILRALYELEEGDWEIGVDWMRLGFLSASMAKSGSWVGVKRILSPSLNQHWARISWTSDRNRHNRIDGDAHSLVINPRGELMSHSKTEILLTENWVRRARNHTIGDEKYNMALEVANIIHKAIIVEQRAKFHPPRSKINTYTMSDPGAEHNKAKRPKVP